MDHERLVELAAGGNVRAFVELTKQHVAFGSALSLRDDFQRAEDVVQQAFVSAWTALPSLADKAAFPGWSRAIVRRHAFRVARRKRAQMLPLWEAAGVADETSPDDQLEHRQQAAKALAAIVAQPRRANPRRCFRARVLASGHRHVPETSGGDGEQPFACRPCAIETEDADYGVTNAAGAWTTQQFRRPYWAPH
jgi:DNA-directed RNA polymerase specialized sigma24 family protein